MALDSLFWSGKRVVLTGHTGFKGGWLALWLQQLGAIVTGISLAPGTTPNLFESANVGGNLESHICDIRDLNSLSKIIRNCNPDIVFHLAAQPLVRASYCDPLETFEVNIMGTAHVLEAIRGTSNTRVAIMVTTDKVYANHEWVYPYREQDSLGGHDPYSASKAASEIVIASYRDSFLAGNGVAIASARAGNVIGGGDWSEDRLIPDAVRAWNSGGSLVLRNSSAVRPWQHVLEPLCGYMTLAEHLWKRPDLAGPYNFGPETAKAATVGQVVELARNIWGAANVTSEKTPIQTLHEAGRLALEIAKSQTLLGVHPLWTLEEAISKTLTWYKNYYNGTSAATLCETDISEYMRSLQNFPAS